MRKQRSDTGTKRDYLAILARREMKAGKSEVDFVNQFAPGQQEQALAVWQKAEQGQTAFAGRGRNEHRTKKRN